MTSIHYSFPNLFTYYISFSLFNLPSYLILGVLVSMEQVRKVKHQVDESLSDIPKVT